MDPNFSFWATKGDSTKAIHAGQSPDPTSGAVVTPISMSTTFAQQSIGVHKGWDYSRAGNPTRDVWERCCAALEGAEHGVSFGSGLGALTTLVHLMKAGDHLVAMSDCYGGTFRYIARVAGNFDLKYSFVDFQDEAEVRAAIAQSNGKTKMVLFETPSNPSLKIVDIAKIVALTREVAPGALVVVDNTFATPYYQKPLALGADVVLHSVTKYLNGHSDVVHGMLVTRNAKVADQLRFLQKSMGAVPSPMDCWLCMRGAKTLAIRMEAHSKNAMAVAQFLEKHAKVEKVLYPGLPSHPQHELAKKQQTGFGGMVTFYLKGDMTHSRLFMENLHVFTLAESLGAVESLANHPAVMTHASLPEEDRLKLGITSQMIRLSVGIEDIKDLLDDLEHAFSKVTL